MKLKSIFAGAAALAMAASAVVYATGLTAAGFSAPMRAVATHHIPGSMNLDDWTYENCRSQGGNVGYVSAGATATIDFTCDETGAYQMEWEWSYTTADNVVIEITDLTTGKKEVDQNWKPSNGQAEVKLEGLITAGEKNIKLTIEGDPNIQFMGNFTTPTFTKISDTYDPIGIPGALPLAEWSYVTCKTENNNANVGYVTPGASATIEFLCKETGAYRMDIETKLYNGGTLNIAVVDKKTGAKQVNQNWTIADGQQEILLEGLITEGKKTMTFTFTSEQSSFIANYYEPSFVKVADTYEDSGNVPEGWDVIPGEIPLTNWTYHNARTENDGANVGCVTAGAYAESNFYCTEQGVYALDTDFNWFNKAADFVVTVIDDATAKKEVEHTYTVTGKHHPEILLPGLITKGKKSVRFDVKTNEGGYIFNWTTPNFIKKGNSLARMTALNVADESILTADAGDNDYSFLIPLNYDGSTVVFTPEVEESEFTVTASAGVTVTDLGNGSYSIPTPAPNAETIVTVALNAPEGTFIEKEQYTVRFFRLGDVVVSALSINSLELTAEQLDALNNDAALTLNDYVFTAVPAVTASFLDGSSAKASVKVDGNSATYTFKGTAADKEKSFTLTVGGIHLYTPGENDLTATLRYDASCNKGDDVWTDGLSTFTPVGDGWGGTQFKLNKKAGNEFSLTLPNDRKVRQLILASLFDNYEVGKITSITSEGATLWMPSESSFAHGGPGYDLIVNVENHVAGTPFVITIEGGSQPVMWFDYTYEIYAPSDAPTMLESATSDLTGRNHTVVSFKFNRQVTASAVTFNGSSIEPVVNGSTAYYSLWNLDYDTEYTFTLPAGAVADAYGNATTEAFSCTFTTGSDNYAETVETERFIRVTDVDELRAAVATLASTNKKADSPLTIIYLHDGDYDLGKDGHLDICNFYNVSLIGQSMEGTLIHSEITGISNPVLSTRHSTNIYMENLTIRNDLDFNKAERVGVGVCHYGGNLDVMKNVTMQSIQDTQVTGERGYYYNCTFHGAVDYVCGGGDHFYDHCTFVQMGDGFLTAPSTSTMNRYGYVMVDCEIKGEGSYTLGRPWQNEPRNYWINTKMTHQPTTAGWGSMSNLTTHFYEYNSMDASGNPIDLSGRRNSPTSTNTYTPILTKEEAETFTIHNVLGGTDSFDPTELIAECDAPEVTFTETGLEWNKVKGAAGYIVYLNSTPAHYTTDTRYDFPDAPAAVVAREAAVKEYTVAAVSSNGSHGTLSAPAKETTGIFTITADDSQEVEYYNLQGIRVTNPENGVFIRRQGRDVKKVIL